MEKDVSIVLVGAAGQGIETVASFMATVLKLSGYDVFVTREFMSRIRGGVNSLQLRVSSDPLGAFVLRTNILVPLTREAISHLRNYGRVNERTFFIGDEGVIGDLDVASNMKIAVPFNDIAEEIGGKIFSNTVAAGVVTSLFGVRDETAALYLRTRFGSKGEKVVNQNIEAFRAGQKIGERLKELNKLRIDADVDPSAGERLLISGTEAVALGAIAGGCNFIASYPMSPSTGVLTILSQKSKKFGIIVDQVEDEIAAINKAIGAWYAGARAMVTTSGGGFALMTEGVSLAGMLENPVVIHLAQRPGPATGLPTRTEQGDLNLALNAGHGEFPRIILTPGTPEDAFYLTQRAFNLADKYQIPVIILTDQFLLDSSFSSPSPDLSKIKVEKYFVKTESGYKRYQLTETGISPRGIPGFGEGLVGVDSDEHDEEGHITEDLNLRAKMVDKRLHKKIKLLKRESIPPELYGKDDFKVLALAWGSNYHVVKEAVNRTGKAEVSMLFFKQVCPLSPQTVEYLEKADEVVVIENNATGQFARLIQVETGYKVPESNRLLKYDGLPFPVEQVEQFLRDVGKQDRER